MANNISIDADFVINEQPDIQADLHINFIPDVSNFVTREELAEDLADKQDVLTAGDNIQIEDNVISATDTTYTAGEGISIEDNVISNTQTSAEWGNIQGDIAEQTDLIDLIDTKIDIEATARENNDLALQNGINTLNNDLTAEISNRGTADGILQDNIDTLSGTVTSNYNTLDGKIGDNKTAIDNHIADKTNPHEVTKSQVGLGNVDNTSDLNKPISTATQTALDGKQNTINDLSEIRTNASNGQSAYNTIQNYGDIVTYNASSFATSIQGQKADTALQPNDDISELNNDVGYITSASLPTVNNPTITFQKNDITVGDINLNQANNETINFNIPTTASDVNALPDTTTINDLTTTAQQNAIDSGANTTNIGQIATNTSNISSLSTTVTNNYNTLDGRITSEVSTLNTAIGTETTNRQNADNNLQSQIDAIVSSSDVFDIVGTYAELQAYDISTVPVNDIIKVLVDSTHNNAATYYRCVENNNVKSWSYIGAEGAYYTKSESNSLFVDKSTTINGQDLSNNITLTALDVGALPSSTTIGSGILTIQNNGVDVDSFNANATSNKSINIVTPTKTSDLVNDSGFIDNSDLSDFVTQTDLTDGLATKQDTISDLSTIRSNAQNGQSAYTTIQGYGDIVSYNASNFATSTQGGKADSAIQTVQVNGTALTPDSNNAVNVPVPTNTNQLTNGAGYITGISSSDVTTALGYTPYDSSNPSGYTTNTGTVTSVNSTQPDADGNVTLLIPAAVTVDSALSTTSENPVQNKVINSALSDKYDASNPNGYTSNVGTVTSVNNASPDSNGNVSLTIPAQTDVKINNTSITSNNVANIVTNTSYDASSNKIATMSDLPTESTVSGWGFTKNAGTITGITMNGSSKGTSGVVDLGTVITAHQDISGKVDKTSIVSTVSSSSTNSQVVGAKLFYDTCGDIETLINAL